MLNPEIKDALFATVKLRTKCHLIKFYAFPIQRGEQT